MLRHAKRACLAFAYLRYGENHGGPTGFLTACSLGRAKRIVYVAPYISILSQATDDIRKATGLRFQHHHLSVVQNPDFAEDDDLLLMESWQAPIVATTFNQLFLALFPRRAQHSMRLRALEGAFVIVDEPRLSTRLRGRSSPNGGA